MSLSTSTAKPDLEMTAWKPSALALAFRIVSVAFLIDAGHSVVEALAADLGDFGFSLGVATGVVSAVLGGWSCWMIAAAIAGSGPDDLPDEEALRRFLRVLAIAFIYFAVSEVSAYVDGFGLRWNGLDWALINGQWVAVYLGTGLAIWLSADRTFTQRGKVYLGLIQPKVLKVFGISYSAALAFWIIWTATSPDISLDLNSFTRFASLALLTYGFLKGSSSQRRDLAFWSVTAGFLLNLSVVQLGLSSLLGTLYLPAAGVGLLIVRAAGPSSEENLVSP